MINSGWFDRALAERHNPEGNGPLYARLERIIREAIESGELPPGHQLPPMGDLATDLGISTPMATRIYKDLDDGGYVSRQVGRGTFVTEPHERAARLRTKDTAAALIRRRPTPPRQTLRRAALEAQVSRGRAANPSAHNMGRGTPDPATFPLKQLQDAWKAAMPTQAEDLGYPKYFDPEDELTAALLPRLEADGIGAQAGNLVLASGFQQFLGWMAGLAGHGAIAAVEEPGYPAAMDALEHAGLRLVGMAMDDRGVRPESLEAALNHGASLVVLTPRAQSPTGASWDSQRRDELAAVLTRYPDVYVMEDDYFGAAATPSPGSLFANPDLSPRTLYVCSFGKPMGPDLRLSAGVADPALREKLLQAKSFDGFTSRLMQRLLAGVLAADGTQAAMDRAREMYADRRRAFTEAFTEALTALGLHSDDLVCGADGLHVWVPTAGRSAAAVADAAARLGFQVAASGPFYIEPGNDGFVRVNVGAFGLGTVRKAGGTVATAISEVPSQRMALTL